MIQGGEKMEVMHIVGNRPQFIKLAPVSRALRKREIEEIVIHTGQHYDKNMSDVFFEEMGIPKPFKNLNVGSGSHAQITGKAMMEIEKVMMEFKPKCAVVYGDTDSTLAAALAAAKLYIPIVHVEAGPRTFNRKNPEECNRVITDHIADYLCTPNRISAENLLNEGIDKSRIFFTGDVMYDEYLHCMSQLRKKISYEDDYILMTWHRQENTCSKERMEKIINFIERINYNIILPLHPRTRKMLKEYGLEGRINGISLLKIIEPVGYKEMVDLLYHCRLLISDSGGASKEASFVGKKCIFMLNVDIWPDLVKEGYLQMVDFDNDKMAEDGIEEIRRIIVQGKELHKIDIFGDGNAAEKIADIIEKII